MLPVDNLDNPEIYVLAFMYIKADAESAEVV